MSQRRNNIISVYEHEELSKMHATYGAKSLDELNTDYDTTVEELENYEVKLTDEQKNTLLALLQSDTLYELPYTLSRGILELNESLTKGNTIAIGHYRIFQKIYTGTTFKSIAGAQILFDALEATRAHNIAIAKLEEKLKIIANYLNRKEQEESTGLEFKEGDAEKQVQAETGTVVGKAEEPTSENKADMEVVK